MRGFTQDDAHIFCLPEQLTDEITGVLDLTEEILSKFGFTEYEIMLSTRPDKAIGSDEIWDLATNALEDALHQIEHLRAARRTRRHVGQHGARRHVGRRGTSQSRGLGWSGRFAHIRDLVGELLG